MGGKQQGTGSNKKGMAHGTHNKSTWQYKTKTKAYGKEKQNLANIQKQKHTEKTRNTGGQELKRQNK